MLELKNIVKTYTVGDITQNALGGVSVSFRENEFVSVLGPSGSGKTTLLNIIGGLDRYTSGDLVIGGRSTKEYDDHDWDAYRNDSIGFVFQSYNLIPHQSVLANVELALTLSGVSRKERRGRAVRVLKRVGLGDHLHKKPSQMSGGQMQRVAIARALINNPDILLADEPTGALDSETSVQIMELLSEIAKDKLVIMVTHNPELAETYSTRIIKLRDGRITDDSNSYDASSEQVVERRRIRTSMSFFTALSLSFDNLRTKKGRTVLTSFAGSIGIIGIALILALSTGMNAYIAGVQKDTMSSYPITISSETVDVSGIMGVRGEVIGSIRGDGKENADLSGIYADYTSLKTSEMMTTSIVKNNLTEFKKYLDDPSSEIHKYLSEDGISYSYDVSFEVFSRNSDGPLINSGAELDGSSSMIGNVGIMNKLNSITGGGSGGAAEGFSELASGTGGNMISQVILDGYELVSGSFPTSYDEVLLVLDRNNSIDAGTLYRLGLITYGQYKAASDAIKAGEEPEEIKLSYESLSEHRFYLVSACDRYAQNENGTFSYIEESVINEKRLLENAIELKISGVVRPTGESSAQSITTAVAYTSALTDHIISHTNDSAVVKAQRENPEINVLTGMRFESSDDAERATDAKNFLLSLSVSEKASFYKLMMYYSGNVGMGATDEASMARALEIYLSGEPSEEILLKVYNEYLGDSSYEENMSVFGNVSYDTPSSISLYTDTFENKEGIAACITRYNESVVEDARITYTDYVSILTSSLTTIIDGISYVLVAFVSISLIVSCIMIGIITHISVMERTKEIGILRALGASKRNVSRVFNAETFIIGCFSGIIGIGLSLLLTIPINSVIAMLTGIEGLNATLPVSSALILIILSIAITVVGGLVPSRAAAKKDPVVALRTE